MLDTPLEKEIDGGAAEATIQSIREAIENPDLTEQERADLLAKAEQMGRKISEIKMAISVV